MHKRKRYNICLCYHGFVTSEASRSAFRHYVPDVLAQIDYLLGLGYEFVSATKYIEWYLEKWTPKGNIACIIIDDGLESIKYIHEHLGARSLPYAIAVEGFQTRGYVPQGEYASWELLTHFVETGDVEICSHTDALHLQAIAGALAEYAEPEPALEMPWWIDDGENLWQTGIDRHTGQKDARWYWEASYYDRCSWRVPFFGCTPESNFSEKIKSEFSFIARKTGTVKLMRFYAHVHTPYGTGYDCKVRMRVNGKTRGTLTIALKDYETRLQWPEAEIMTLKLPTPFAIEAGEYYTISFETLTQGNGSFCIRALPYFPGDCETDVQHSLETSCGQVGGEAHEGYWSAPFPAGSPYPASPMVILSFGGGRQATQEEFAACVSADTKSFRGRVSKYLGCAWKTIGIDAQGGGQRIFWGYNGGKYTSYCTFTVSERMLVEAIKFRPDQSTGEEYAAICDVYLEKLEYVFPAFWAQPKVVSRQKILRLQPSWLWWKQRKDIWQYKRDNGGKLPENIWKYGFGPSVMKSPWELVPGDTPQFCVETDAHVWLEPNKTSGGFLETRDFYRLVVETKNAMPPGLGTHGYDCVNYITLVCCVPRQVPMQIPQVIVFPYGSYEAEDRIDWREALTVDLGRIYESDGMIGGFTIWPGRQDTQSKLREFSMMVTPFTLSRYMSLGNLSVKLSLDQIKQYIGVWFEDQMHEGVNWQVSFEPIPLGVAQVYQNFRALDYPTFDAYFVREGGVIKRSVVNDGGHYFDGMKGRTGDFIAGERIVGQISGATATVVWANNTPKLPLIMMQWQYQTFEAGQTVRGTKSGASCVIVACNSENQAIKYDPDTLQGAFIVGEEITNDLYGAEEATGGVEEWGMIATDDIMKCADIAGTFIAGEKIVGQISGAYAWPEQTAVHFKDDKGFLQSRGIACFIIIGNGNYSDPTVDDVDESLAHVAINNPDLYIPKIVEICVEENWDGITSNLEAVPQEDREATTEYLKRLAIELHKHGKLLQTTSPARTDALDPDSIDKKLTLSNVQKSFREAEIIRGDESGATATVTGEEETEAVYGETLLLYKNLRGEFAQGETVRGQASGATAKVNAVGAYYDWQSWVGWCDHGAIAKVVDGIKIMSYTESGPYSDPRPAAPDWFMKAVYAYCRAHIPKEFWPRVYVGCNLFGHMWQTGVEGWADYKTYQDAISEALQKEGDIEVKDGEGHWVGAGHECWFGCPATVTRAARIAAENGFGGIGLWMLSDGDMYECLPTYRQLGRYEKVDFLEIRFPEDISYGATGGPMYKTQVLRGDGGAENRVQCWTDALCQYDVEKMMDNQKKLEQLLAFFRVVRGRRYGFRFKDWSDYRIAAATIGIGDGSRTGFQIVKQYTFGNYSINRKICKIVSGSWRIYQDGLPVKSGVSVDENTGEVHFVTAPPSGSIVSVDCEFDVPVRFDIDYLPTNLDNYNTAKSSGIGLVEIRL